MHTLQHLDSFKKRVTKIQDPKFNHIIDPETGMKIPRRITRDQIGKGPQASRQALGMGFLLGMLCLMVARYVRMEVISVEPYFPDGMMVELVMASVAAVIIGGFVGLRNMRVAVAQLAGAVVCAVSMHNAVWVAPDHFAMVFSQGYVDRILALTDPMSLYINGLTLTLKV